MLSHGSEVGAGDRSGGRRAGAAPRPDPLKAYATDLVARAAAGQIDPLIGRALEIERMIQVLCRRRKNNPLLVGEPGVGKTALAEGLALRIHQGEGARRAEGGRVSTRSIWVRWSPARVIAVTSRSASSRCSIGSRRKRTRSSSSTRSTRSSGAGAASGGAMDAGNLLKPALASGPLRCIGSTTFNDVKQSFDRDRALSRRFQKIDVLEPSEDETLEILKGLRLHYESHHGVQYDDEALDAAVALSARHLQDLHLPDKAIDVLDEAGAAQKLLPAAARTRSIGAAQIEQIVAKMARVPVQTVSSDDKRALERLDAELKQVIFGQDGPIDEVASAIKLSRSGLRAPDKPIGNFLFAGPTGVGKTELARQLARIMGIEFIRFDMSEYMEKHAVSRLIGAPPGYVGYEEGGLLIDAIRKAPHAVLLLDEIEKAHPDMFSILLQVMDHATLTDSHGRKADFRHVVLIMTTNAGARDLSDRHLGFAEQGKGGSSRGALERMFTPEFRNRLDAIVTFGALGTTEIEKVVDKQIDEVRGMVAAKKVTIAIDPAARTWLAAKGFDRAFGARPMARLIERVIKKPLSEMLLFGVARRQGGAVRVAVEDDAHPAGDRRLNEPGRRPARVSRSAAQRIRVRRRSVRAVRALVRAGPRDRGRSRPRWRSPPRRARAVRRSATCCSRAWTIAASCSTPTTRAARRVNWTRPAGPACSSPGARLERQVRIDGTVEKVSPAESDAYFATRPIESRWSVYASRQSEVVDSRDDARVAVQRRA